MVRVAFSGQAQHLGEETVLMVGVESIVFTSLSDRSWGAMGMLDYFYKGFLFGIWICAIPAHHFDYVNTIIDIHFNSLKANVITAN